MTLGLFPLVSLPISALLFFGPYCLLIGYLIFRSTFLPRILGALMALAGLGWLAFLTPNLAHSLSLCIEGLGIFAEASLMLWLLVMGVNVKRWKEQADAAVEDRLLSTQRSGGVAVNEATLIRMRLTQSAWIRMKEYEHSYMDGTDKKKCRRVSRPGWPVAFTCSGVLTAFIPRVATLGGRLGYAANNCYHPDVEHG